MNLAVVLFAAVAAVTALGAVGVAASRSMVRAGVWLLVTLAGVAGLYFLLGAEFLGAAQLIIYVGGTLVLVVFGVMITSQGPFAVLQTKRMEWVIGGLLAGGLFALLAVASMQLGQRETTEATSPAVHELGLSFLGVGQGGKSYLLPFEIVSVHLLVVLVAAAYLARAKKRVDPDGRRDPIETTLKLETLPAGSGQPNSSEARP
ncbi:MAG: NADH-quinone oxidoreductase subunit J [Fimbriiglobus sp.]|jgi:NADH-quinone oxidoreductase subunit J|nr:NADH-quinone oxidoreductase subunit J [Fimbriiglobus sp.]